MLLRPHLLACTLAALCVGTSATAADTYPSKPVKVMVALPAGGSADMLARFNEGYARLRKSPRYKELEDKWFK